MILLDEPTSALDLRHQLQVLGLLRELVRERGLTCLVVLHDLNAAARYADDAGFAVTVVEDCCASPNPQWHEFAITQILPVFGRIASSKDLR